MAPRAGRAWKHSGSDGACKGQNLEMWTNSVPSRGRVGISEVTLDDISFHSVPTGSRRSEGVQTHTAEEQAPIRSPLAPLHSIAGQERARANSVSGWLSGCLERRPGRARQETGGRWANQVAPPPVRPILADLEPFLHSSLLPVLHSFPSLCLITHTAHTDERDDVLPLRWSNPSSNVTIVNPRQAWRQRRH